MVRIEPKRTDRGIKIGEGLSSVTREVTLVNPIDRNWTRHRYVLWFGAYGTTRLMVYANALGDALEEAMDWIVDHAPGLLADEVAREAYEEAIAEGKTQEEAWEIMEQDLTMTSHNGIHYIPSWEWGIALEDPTREELEAYLYPHGR